jgi:hypothetical protein
MCEKTLYSHCLQMRGEHTNPEHIKVMIDCINICQQAADFMTRQSKMYQTVCNACADIAYACALSCEEFEDETMQACAQLCRECAEHCDEMGLSQVFESGETLAPNQMNFI